MSRSDTPKKVVLDSDYVVGFRSTLFWKVSGSAELTTEPIPPVPVPHQPGKTKVGTRIWIVAIPVPDFLKTTLARNIEIPDKKILLLCSKPVLIQSSFHKKAHLPEATFLVRQNVTLPVLGLNFRYMYKIKPVKFTRKVASVYCKAVVSSWMIKDNNFVFLVKQCLIWGFFLCNDQRSIGVIFCNLCTFYARGQCRY